MDFFKLKSNIQNLLDSSQLYIDEIRKLYNFFSLYNNDSLEYYTTLENKIKSDINNSPIAHSSILLANMNEIYIVFQNLIENQKKLMIKMSNEILIPLLEFKKNQFDIYQDNINAFRGIDNELEIIRAKLQNSKNNYLKSSYELFNYEKEKKDDEEYKEKLLILRSQTKNYEILYKYNLIRFNNTISDFKLKYKVITATINKNEENRIYYIHTIFNKINKIFKEFSTNYENFNNIIENYISLDICKKDMKNSQKEIEEILKYDESLFKKEEFISFNEFYKDKNENFPELEITEDETEILDEIQMTLKIKKILDNIFNEKDIAIDDIAAFIGLMKNNHDFEKKFLDSLLERKKTTKIKMSNLYNLQSLSNILIFITLNHSSISTECFDFNFKIIFISERIYYEKDKKKIYLCALLSKNILFRTKNFWKDIITLKLANKIQDHIIRLKNYKLPEEKKKGFFKKLSGKFGIGKDQYLNSVLGKTKIFKLVKDYTEIEQSKIPVVDRILLNELETILQENIPSFNNFNLSKKESNSLLEDFMNEYFIPKEKIDFFKIYNDVSFLTIRKLLLNENINYNYYVFNKLDNDKNIIQVFKYSNILQFLNTKDFINLLILNKNINNKLSKKIYKYVLKNSNKKLTKQNRLEIWQNLLKSNQLKKNFIYKEVLKNHNKDEQFMTEINLDVVRTYFSNESGDLNENREKLKNILLSVCSINNNIKYCQGMNYIAAFFLEISNGNEETSFYLFLALFLNTEYSLIFSKDLYKLKIFFYIFKRIVQLNEPELYSYLNSNSIEVQFFLPNWFITLFLSSREYNKENGTEVILRILDNFFLSGWKNMFKIGIFILHTFENELINLDYEKMLSYLINDLLKNDFFSEKNLPGIENAINDNKITKKLIKNIENEFILEEKLKNNKKDNE